MSSWLSGQLEIHSEVLLQTTKKQTEKKSPKYKIKFPFYFIRFWSPYHIPWRIWETTTLDHRERSFSTSVNLSEKIRSFLSFVVQFIYSPNATTVSTTQHNEIEEASAPSLIHTQTFVNFRTILCVRMFWLHLYLCTTFMQCPYKPEESIGSPGTGVIELPHGCWEQNVGLPEEQSVVSISPVPHSKYCYFYDSGT